MTIFPTMISYLNSQGLMPGVTLCTALSAFLVVTLGMSVSPGTSRVRLVAAVQKTDTTENSPIPIKSCTGYEWFIEPKEEDEKPKIEYINHRYIGSLHAFTCQWAVMTQTLSVDSTQLPKYVQPIGDSLRLAENVLAYSVNMKEVGDSSPKNSLFFVAEVGDSLFYHQIDDYYENNIDQYYDTTGEADPKQSWRIRALRPLDVSGSQSQYLWFEFAHLTEGTKNGNHYSSERWTGHIYTYDERQGIRHLHMAPIRSVTRKNGSIVRAKQWDVSVPKPGIMLIEPRLEKGDDPTLESPQRWVGRHVIDPAVTTKREVDIPRDATNQTIIIDTTKVENWREKYDQ